MLSIELLKIMDDQHAVNALRADPDIAADPLKASLVDWIETLVNEAADSEPVAKVMANHNLETSDVEALADALIENAKTTVALLNALGEANFTTVTELNDLLALDDLLEEAGIDTPTALQERLDLSDKLADAEDRIADLERDLMMALA